MGAKPKAALPANAQLGQGRAGRSGAGVHQTLFSFLPIHSRVRVGFCLSCVTGRFCFFNLALSQECCSPSAPVTAQTHPTDFSPMEVLKPLGPEQPGAGEAAQGPARQMGSQSNLFITY